jgi:hypothetical protein
MPCVPSPPDSDFLTGLAGYGSGQFSEKKTSGGPEEAMAWERNCSLASMARMALFGEVTNAGWCALCGAKTINSAVCSLHEEQVLTRF